MKAVHEAWALPWIKSDIVKHTPVISNIYNLKNYFYSVHFKPSKALQTEIWVNICRIESNLRFQVRTLLHYKLLKCNMAVETFAKWGMFARKLVFLETITSLVSATRG